MHVSVVIPAHDEQGNIGRLIEEIYQVVPASLLSEVIVVDDGSQDETYCEVAALAGRYANLRCLRHHARCGKSAACRTGIEAALGPVIACIDGDGQHDPRDIARMMEKLTPPGTPGAAFVAGFRSSRATPRAGGCVSPLLLWLQRRLFHVDLPASLCGPQLFWKEAYLHLPKCRRQHMHLPLLFSLDEHRIDFIPTSHRQRLVGRSKSAGRLPLLPVLLDLAAFIWLARALPAPMIVDEIGQPTRLLSFSTHRRKRG